MHDGLSRPHHSRTGGKVAPLMDRVEEVDDQLERGRIRLGPPSSRDTSPFDHGQEQSATECKHVDVHPVGSGEAHGRMVSAGAGREAEGSKPQAGTPNQRGEQCHGEEMSRTGPFVLPESDLLTLFDSQLEATRKHLIYEQDGALAHMYDSRCR